jgi:hypothetical protein
LPRPTTTLRNAFPRGSGQFSGPFCPADHRSRLNAGWLPRPGHRCQQRRSGSVPPPTPTVKHARPPSWRGHRKASYFGVGTSRLSAKEEPGPDSDGARAASFCFAAVLPLLNKLFQLLSQPFVECGIFIEVNRATFARDVLHFATLASGSPLDRSTPTEEIAS